MSGASAGQSEPETLVGDERDHSSMTTGASIDRYLVIDRLGEGGMGVVLRAYDPKLQREVALKLIRNRGRSERSESAKARLMREAQTMARLAHPNVVPVFDVGAHGDDLFVAMELVEGDNLRGWLRQRDRSVTEIVDAFIQASEGLHAAHAEGLVHRDLKPGNLLVGNDGRVRVVDFGLARAVGSDTADSHHSGIGDVAGNQDHLTAPLTEVGSVVGTPAYMAPEQHRGTAADHRSDQYSLCLTLYEAVYGRRPFDATNNAALARQKTDGPPMVGERKGVPRGLVRLIRRGLQPDPEARFASMAEVALALRRLRSRQSVAVGASVAVVAVGLGVWAIVPDSNEGACLAAATAIEGTWNEQRRSELQHAYEHTEVTYARDAWMRTERVVDTWFRGWAEVNDQACQATRVRGEQSEDRLAARTRCLEAARKRADALLDVMKDARPEAIAGGLAAFATLPPAAKCLEAIAGEPSESADADQDRVAAMVMLGDGSVALPMARQIEERTEGAAKAEAALWVGTALMADERRASAREYLERAFFTAGRNERPDLARDAAVVLARGLAEEERWEDAEEWAEHAATMAARGRVGARERLEAKALAAALAARTGTTDALRALFDEATDLLGAPDPTTLAVASLLGEVAWQGGELERAQEVLLEARARTVESVGAEHPDVAVVDLALARVDLTAGRIDAAKDKLESAADALRSSLGPDNDHTIDAIALLGQAHARAGEHDDARRLLNGAFEVSKRAKGAEHPRTRRLAEQLAGG